MHQFNPSCKIYWNTNHLWAFMKSGFGMFNPVALNSWNSSSAIFNRTTFDGFFKLLFSMTDIAYSLVECNTQDWLDSRHTHSGDIMNYVAMKMYQGIVPLLSKPQVCQLSVGKSSLNSTQLGLMTKSQVHNFSCPNLTKFNLNAMKQ